PTAAFAGDDDREESSLNVCERSNIYKCDNWNYFENSSEIYFDTPLVLGSDAQTCPSDEVLSSTASTTGRTIGSTKSWRFGGDIDNKVFGPIGVKLSASYSEGISNSVTTSTTYTKPIPRGHIGHMTFSPKMYYSEGQMNWTRTDVASEFHDKDDYKTHIESRTPMTLQSGAEAGRYNLESRPMTSDEIKSLCPHEPVTPDPTDIWIPGPLDNIIYPRG
ncbi:hypothetical protein, partial [Salinibacterium sp.]